jgi:hypothetical protein
VDAPLELRIPSLKVSAPVVGVGLNSENLMDSPRGPNDDPLGRPEIFAHLEELQPGDLIIVHYTTPHTDTRFIVNQIRVYSVHESSDPAVLSLASPAREGVSMPVSPRTWSGSSTW